MRNRIIPAVLILAAVLVFSATISKSEELPSGLVSYWSFDEGSGTTAYDSVGSNNGTLINGPVWTAGEVGGALRFDGSNDYVNVGTMGDFGSANLAEFTVSLWVKTGINDRFMTLLGTTNGWTDDRTDYELDLNLDSRGNISKGTVNVRLYDRDGSILRAAVDTDTGITDDDPEYDDTVWHHLIVVVKKAAGKVDIYVDGQAQAVTYADRETGINFMNFVNPLVLGAYNNNGSITHYFYGILDDVMIFNGALSAEKFLELCRREPEEVTGFQINGPAEAVVGSPSLYKGIACFSDGNQCDVSEWTQGWRVEPNYLADISQGGLLRPKESGLGQTVTVYCSYTLNGVTFEAQMPVDIIAPKLLQVPSEYPTIQAAVNAAVDSDVVVVSPGIYQGTNNKNIDFKGKRITVRSVEPNDPNVVNATVIDCQDDDTGFYFHSGEDQNSVVDGFKIINGSGRYVGDPVSRSPVGGGVCCYQSSPVISRCVVSGSSASAGGGIGCYKSNVLISKCIIANNSAGKGGGVYLYGDCIIKDCEITNNQSSYVGGGIDISNGANKIIDCVISDNVAGPESHYEDGGGIYSFRSSSDKATTITGCKITGNRGNDGGGIYLRDYPTQLFPLASDISNCEISGNIASEWGGGVCCYPYDYLRAVIRGCVISGNRSGTYAGGVYGGRIENCTIVGNKSIYNGGFRWGWYGGDNIRNSILRANRPSQIDSPEVGYCNIEGGWQGNGEGNIDVDPMFVRDGYWDPNGTPENLNDDFWVDGDYRLKSEGWYWDSGRQRWDYSDVTSRCIDAGNPGTPLGDELLSIPDDPENMWGENLRIDMGAYGGTAEASMPPHNWTVLSDLTNDGIVNSHDYAYFASDWLNAGIQQPGDLNRDGVINFDDLGLLVEDWLKETTWR